MNTYDRQLHEPEEAWTAFYRYRDLPNPRPSVAAFADSAGYPSSRILAWSKTYDWLARVVAWDQRVDAVRQSSTLRGVEEMAQRHIRIACKGLDVAEIAIDKITKDLANEFGRLKPQEIARLVEVLTKLERLSRGEATERIEGEGHDYSKLSDADLAALENITKKL